jgi:hypothetical protein
VAPAGQDTATESAHTPANAQRHKAITILTAYVTHGFGHNQTALSVLLVLVNLKVIPIA